MYKKVTFFSSLTVLLLGGGVLLYLFFRYLAGVLLPFLLGWLLAMLSRKPAFWLHKRLGVTQGATRLFCVGAIAALLGGIVVFGVRGLFHELSLVLGRFEAEGTDLLARVKEWLASVPLIGDRLAEGSFWKEGITMLLSVLPGVVSAFANFLPSFFFTMFVGVIAAVYFCLDLDRIHAALLSRVPKEMLLPIQRLKSSAFRAAFSVLRAQGILSLVAFGMLLLGFILLDVKYPLLLSMVFSVLDFLPVLGVGVFLVPWAVFSLVTGAHTLGVGLLILFGAIAVVRQFLEPRILGRGYGLHPLVTLLSLYAGGRLFGFFGLLVFPALTLVLYEVLLGGEKTGDAPTDGEKISQST